MTELLHFHRENKIPKTVWQNKQTKKLCIIWCSFSFSDSFTTPDNLQIMWKLKDSLMILPDVLLIQIIKYPNQWAFYRLKYPASSLILLRYFHVKRPFRMYTKVKILILKCVRWWVKYFSLVIYPVLFLQCPWHRHDIYFFNENKRVSSLSSHSKWWSLNLNPKLNCQYANYPNALFSFNSHYKPISEA